MRKRTRVICLALSLVLTIQPLSGAQTITPAGDSNQGGNDQGNGSGRQSHHPLHDYTACAFSDENDYELRARNTPAPHPRTKPADHTESPKTLSGPEAQQLWEQAYVALLKTLNDNPEYSPEIAQGLTEYYQMHSKPDELVGMTLDQANTHIQKIIADAGTQVRSKYSQTLANAKDQASLELQDIVGNPADVFVTKEKNVPKGQQPPQHLSAEDAARITNEAKEAISKSKNFTPEYAARTAASFQPDASLLQELHLEQVSDYFRFLAKQSASNSTVYPFPNTVPYPLENLEAKVVSVQAEVAKQTKSPPPEGRTFERPEDISCSMAIMGWKETSDIFGRRVANRYVAVQVTLRNLNTKNEFLVHDIQVAVDTGISQDEFGRFQAGRDKLLVRAVAERGKSEDRRNVILNSLTALGAIAGASSVTAGTIEFKDAVAIFQGSFITGFANIFPDHTVEQLNHINDLVFSASNTSKVLVPVQGSVPLVTFIAETPLEELPFAWCGHPPKVWFKRGLGLNPEQNCDFNGENRDDSATEKKTGYIDDYHYRQGHGALENGSDYEKEEGSLQKVKDGDNSPQPWTSLHYKNWRGAAVRMLEEHTFVIVGGVHIQEVAKQGTISNLDCAGTLISGPIDISQTKDGAVQCTVTGEALDKVNSVKLEKDTDKITGKLIPAKDGNSATLEFDPENLADKDGTYSLYLVDSSGAETDSGESVALSKQPFIKDIKSPFDSANPSLTLEGKNLSLLQSVTLVLDSNKNTEFPGDFGSDKGDSSRTATFKATDWGAGDFHLKYTISAEPTKTKDTNLPVKRAAASQGAAAQAPAAPATPAKAKAAAKPKPAAPGKPTPASGNQQH